MCLSHSDYMRHFESVSSGLQVDTGSGVSSEQAEALARALAPGLRLEATALASKTKNHDLS